MPFPSTLTNLTVPSVVSLAGAPDHALLHNELEEIIVGPVFINVKGQGAVGDGVANDSPAIQGAIDALPATGGTVLFPPGTYKLNSGLTVTANKPVLLLGHGAKLKPVANVIAVKINQDVGATNTFAGIDGFVIDGADGAGTEGVRLHNTDRAFIRNTRIQDCAIGVYLLSTDAEWVEGALLDHVFIFSCTDGIKIEKTGTGTGSFGETVLNAVGISACTRGINLVSGSNLYRSFFAGVTVWVDANQKGLFIDGDMNAVAGLIGVEALSATGNTAVEVGANAINTDAMDLVIPLTGTFANDFVVAAGKRLVWHDRDGRIRFKGATGNDLTLRTENTANRRLRMAFFQGATERWSFISDKDENDGQNFGLWDADAAAFRWSVDAPATLETALLVSRNIAGAITLQRVSMDAVDTAGAGFRGLRVPN